MQLQRMRSCTFSSRDGIAPHRSCHARNPRVSIRHNAHHSIPKIVAQTKDWLTALLAPYADRLCVPASTTLFQDGDRAMNYYLLKRGELLVQWRPKPGQPMGRKVNENDLMICDCGGVHVATCDAIADSIVLRFGRHQLEDQATQDPTLKALLQGVHTRELEIILGASPMQMPAPVH